MTDAVGGAAPMDVAPARAASPLAVDGVHKTYTSPAGDLHVLRGVDLTLNPRGVLAIIGASGAGKSTLMHLMGGLDRPTAGEIRIGGRPLAGLDDVELARVRNQEIGFVFQFHHLLREFSAEENVMMPCLIAGVDRRVARTRARDLLAKVGLAERMTHRPSELSGGEQQRVAVARALANEPVVLLADEPSGNLDHHTSERLHDLLFGLREALGLAMVLVTHNAELAHRADRILKLEDGVVLPLEDGEAVPGWHGRQSEGAGGRS
ncbi:MAG TPA: ABC transporter ATP-binding protein [Longimicrobiales bacterium]|nr:ABC transporter ATP-binding protein [Longimicrobiales bacterium]